MGGRFTNAKPVLLVEAKPLDDPLNDVKGVTQVCGYGANDGIAWCVLTNGVVWKVYRSIEKCPAPDKLMYEVSIDPRDRDGLPMDQTARQLWRLSREEMAKGTLDAIGEQTFTDGKVRKALDTIMREGPRPLLNLVRAAVHDGQLTPQQVKQSLARIWSENSRAPSPGKAAATHVSAEREPARSTRSRGAAKAWATRREKATRTSSPYDESHHTTAKPKEAVELYRAVDRLCLAMVPGPVVRRYLAKYIDYQRDKRSFCSVHINQGGLRVWLRLKYGRLANPPAFARDVSRVGHWGNGDLELDITALPQIQEAEPLIRESFDSVR